MDFQAVLCFAGERRGSNESRREAFVGERGLSDGMLGCRYKKGGNYRNSFE